MARSSTKPGISWIGLCNFHSKVGLDACGTINCVFLSITIKASCLKLCNVQFILENELKETQM